ncbi:MAG TPA: hypothetical protein V6D22_07565 [Candidatus Obscuribacterales bacterium]
MVINTVRGVMRIPFILIALGFTVAYAAYVGVTDNAKEAFAVAYLGVLLTFGGCIFAAIGRHLRIERHAFAKMGSAEFKALCQANSDARITFYDSVRSGNCILGSLGFARRTFNYPWRRSITLGELLPYCRTGHRVKSVALYTLIRLSKSSELRPAPKEIV